VRASDPIVASVAELADADWQSSWATAHTVIDVPGSHFTMMEAHAATTAQAVRDWITGNVDV